MKTKKYNIYTVAVFALMVLFTSCLNDLDTIPLDEDVVTSATVYDSPTAYREVLAKCYAGMATTGQEGPAGMPDVGGIDEGFSSYLRGYWNLQELTTEEAITGWGDNGLRDLHDHVWATNNDFVKALYYRIFYQIAVANELIRESSDAKLEERGIDAETRDEIKLYQAEARFLRAMSYWHALDMYRSVPFITEDDGIGAYMPTQISPSDLFIYIENELKDIETLLADPKTNEYARVDKAAAWMLMAKLYLNAEVYIGESKYNECVDYADKVIESGYEMHPVYNELFLADNHTAKGIIYPVAFDGTNTRTWAGMTFIINGGIGGKMVPADYGVSENWGGHRTTKAFVQKFPLYAEASDKSVNINKSTADYPTLNLPGGYQVGSGYGENDWNPGEAPKLYSYNSDNIYEGYLYMKDENQQFKFDVHGDWSLNYGDFGADGTLEEGGDNISLAEAGYYYIKVNLNDFSYTITKTSWGMIGGAVPPYDWSADVDMTFNPENRTWEATLKLNASDIKFRANDGWDLNYGDSNSDGVLELGGDNIPVAEMGKYTIVLDLNGPDFTYTLTKASVDERALFFTEGQQIEIDDVTDFTNGYAITKFRNITSTGASGSHNIYPDTDFPVFRIADAYLMYAEAVLRGGNGDAGKALNLVNQILTRAYGDESGNIEASELTLPFILDERARELYWEGHRRTDLVRFGLLTGGDYIWPWKGGVKEGVETNSRYDIFPIPASDLISNTNLQQYGDY